MTDFVGIFTEFPNQDGRPMWTTGVSGLWEGAALQADESVSSRGEVDGDIMDWHHDLCILGPSNVLPFMFSSEPNDVTPSVPSNTTAFAKPHTSDGVSTPTIYCPRTQMDLIAQSPSMKYAQPRDWEYQRATIHNLYLHNNLTLDDVIDIMKRRHNFNATKKMYKNKFKQWKWRKYGLSEVPLSSRSSRSFTKSCIRQRALRSMALLHENTSAQFKDEVLYTFHSILLSEMDRHFVFFIAEPPSIKYIRDALVYFKFQDFTLAGTYLRRGFFELEKSIRKVDAPRVFALITQTLARLLDHEREDILRIFLSHVKDFSATIATSHPLQRIASALQGLQNAGTDQLRHFVLTLYDLYINWINGQKSVSRLEVLLGNNQRLMRQTRLLGIGLADLGRKVKTIASEYDRRIDEIANGNPQFENEHELLELDRLNIQNDLDIYLDDYVIRLRGLMEYISNQYKGSPFPDSTWARHHFRNYLRLIALLIQYHLKLGNRMAAALEVQSFCKSFVGDSSIEIPQSFFLLIYRLRSCEMDKEADELARIISSTRDLETSVSIPGRPIAKPSISGT